MRQEKIILFIDDDEDDVDLLSSAFQRSDNDVKVTVTKNGAQALEYLNSLKQDPSLLPDLIILDLNMPLIDGKETFHRIKKDIALQMIPIIIFTSSANPNDKTFFEGMNIEMITKPNNFTQMRDIVRHFLDTCESKNA
jgi:CheY-like chemotaxis protein